MENKLYGESQVPIYSNLNEGKKLFPVKKQFLKDELT